MALGFFSCQGPPKTTSAVRLPLRGKRSIAFLLTEREQLYITAKTSPSEIPHALRGRKEKTIDLPLVLDRCPQPEPPFFSIRILYTSSRNRFEMHAITPGLRASPTWFSSAGPKMPEDISFATWSSCFGPRPRALVFACHRMSIRSFSSFFLVLDVGNSKRWCSQTHSGLSIRVY